MKILMYCAHPINGEHKEERSWYFRVMFTIETAQVAQGIRKENYNKRQFFGCLWLIL